MTGFKNKLHSISTDELKTLRQEYQDLTARNAGVCDHLYDRLHCIMTELVDRAVRSIPNAEKYIFNYKSLEVEVFFGPAQSKTFKIRELTQ